MNLLIGLNWMTSWAKEKDVLPFGQSSLNWPSNGKNQKTKVDVHFLTSYDSQFPKINCSLFFLTISILYKKKKKIHFYKPHEQQHLWEMWLLVLESQDSIRFRGVRFFLSEATLIPYMNMTRGTARNHTKVKVIAVV